MYLLPYNDRIVVRPVDREEKTKGGIWIPDVAQDRPVKGTVVAVGPGVMKDDGTRIPVSPAVGDNVYFGKFAGTEFQIDGVKHLLLREVDIICTVKTDIQPGAMHVTELTPESFEYSQDV